jgi:hypothetical protein
VLVADIFALKWGIYHDFLKVESRWNYRKNLAPQKTCRFELALLALFWGIYWVYSGTIVVTWIYFFGDGKF